MRSGARHDQPFVRALDFANQAMGFLVISPMRCPWICSCYSFFSIFSALVGSQISEAATVPGVFNQIDCDGGGWFEQVIPHSSGRIYGRTDIGGMYRSDDHGDTWYFISGDMP